MIGFVRNTLNALRCDVIMGVAVGDDLVQTTNPYYRTTYALVFKPGSGLDGIESLADPRLKGKHIGIVAGTPPATVLVEQGLMALARPYALTVDTRVECADADDGQRHRGRADRRRRAVGSDRRLLCAACDAAPRGRAAAEGAGADGLPHRHGRAPQRPGMEAPAQSAHRGKPAGDRPDSDGVRRAAAGRARQADRAVSTTGHRLGAALGIVLLVGVAGATDAPPPEPPDYRMDDYRAPTPATLRGADGAVDGRRTGHWERHDAVFIDVLPQPPRPVGLPASTIWRPKPRDDVPGSIWLPDTGYGALAPVMQQYFERGLRQATGGDRDRAIVFYCLANCWMSWNAAKRAMALGYTHVAWYPDGTDGWTAQHLPLEARTPVPRPQAAE